MGVQGRGTRWSCLVQHKVTCTARRGCMPLPHTFAAAACPYARPASLSCRFQRNKGADFALVHPNPSMRDFFSEETECEELASTYAMVPERSNLCIWTQDSAAHNKSALLPYVAVTDLDLKVGVGGHKSETPAGGATGGTVAWPAARTAGSRPLHLRAWL